MTVGQAFFQMVKKKNEKPKQKKINKQTKTKQNKKGCVCNQ
jgi:hypothetical protein